MNSVEKTEGALGTGSTLGSLVAALLTILIAIGVIGSGGALAPLLLALGAALLDTTGEQFAAAFTTSVWDTFRCILYCNMQPDASFTEADWQAVKTEILAQTTGIAQKWLHDVTNALGPVGLTNIARYGLTSSNANCDGCNCDEGWCYTWDFTQGSSHWLSVDQYFNANGTDTTPTDASLTPSGWRANQVTTPLNRSYASIKVNLPSAHITSIVFSATGTFGNGFRLNGTAYAAGTGWYVGSENITEIALMTGNDDGTQPSITSVELRGIGTNPFGASNCE